MLIDGNYILLSDPLIMFTIIFLNQAHEKADQSVQKRNFLPRPARLKEMICRVRLQQLSSSYPCNKIRGIIRNTDLRDRRLIHIISLGGIIFDIKYNFYGILPYILKISIRMAT